MAFRFVLSVHFLSTLSLIPLSTSATNSLAGLMTVFFCSFGVLKLSTTLSVSFPGSFSSCLGFKGTVGF